MPNINDVVITPDMLNKIAEIDQFNGSWQGHLAKLTPDDLKVMKRVATIESIGSSNRIEGNKLSDKEVVEKYKDYIDDFKLMEELALILKERRKEQK